jgi:hypothetical protein
MPQKLYIENARRRFQTEAVQLMDEIGPLDFPGVYICHKDAALIANAIEALDSQLKSETDTDAILYAVYFERLKMLKDLIRRDVQS